jgi:preprotein translocase subunit SecD
MKPDDRVILCDSVRFRYGLGPSELPPDAVERAVPLQGQAGDWVVQVQLADAAAPAFAQLTERLAGFGPPLNQVAIVLNGAVVSAPAVQEPITGGTLQISGSFTQDEAEALAASLG